MFAGLHQPADRFRGLHAGGRTGTDGHISVISGASRRFGDRYDRVGVPE
ncbi:hypothetical protein [Streptomyces sp. NPDC014894]